MVIKRHGHNEQDLYVFQEFGTEVGSNDLAIDSHFTRFPKCLVSRFADDWCLVTRKLGLTTFLWFAPQLSYHFSHFPANLYIFNLKIWFCTLIFMKNKFNINTLTQTDFYNC